VDGDFLGADDSSGGEENSEDDDKDGIVKVECLSSSSRDTNNDSNESSGLIPLSVVKVENSNSSTGEKPSSTSKLPSLIQTLQSLSARRKQSAVQSSSPKKYPLTPARFLGKPTPTQRKVPLPKIDPSAEEREKVRAAMEEFKSNVDESGRIFCKECKIYVKQIHFYNHIKFIHLQIKKFLCSACGFRAQSPFVLRQHTRSRHRRETSFRCPHCSRWFDTNEDKEDHVKALHVKPPVRRAKQQICDQCGKTLSSKHQLTRHLRIHANEFPYKCRFCEKAFRFKWACTTHERQHTGLKPYKCSSCQEAFTQNVVRKNHEFRVHGNQMYSPANMKRAEMQRLGKEPSDDALS